MNKTKQLAISSMCLALGIILPQAFHMIPNAGNIFLPMHIPVLICGFIVNPEYSLIIGILTPVLSNFIFSMPATPMLGQMIVELGTYGLMIGILNKVISIKNEYIKTYICLILSMLIGRVVYGLCNYFVFKSNAYSLQIWITTAFVTSLPGIIIQLLIVPLLSVNAKKIIEMK